MLVNCGQKGTKREKQKTAANRIVRDVLSLNQTKVPSEYQCLTIYPKSLATSHILSVAVVRDSEQSVPTYHPARILGQAQIEVTEMV